MGKVYESKVDPDEFIRSFREEPSSLSALKRKEGNALSGQAVTCDGSLPLNQVLSNHLPMKARTTFRERFI